MNDSEMLVIGANGQLGRALQIRYPKAQAVDYDTLDITDESALKKYDWTNIKIILNAAAYTNVDGAETKDGRLSAWKINALAPSYLSKIADAHNITLLHISSDYVFDGSIDLHKEDESFSPISVYGASKAAGDIAISVSDRHYIVRTSWVIGDGNNFVRTMLSLGKKGVSPSVVSDQIGRLTFTDELVDGIDFILNNNLGFGTYNLTNGGKSSSWADIARQIYKLANMNSKVKNVTTEDYYKGKVGIAPRPLQSTLDLGKLKSAGYTPKDWVSGLSNYISKEID